MNTSLSPEAPVRKSNGTGPLPPESPVFILGMHRSGTTLLYELLTETENWNTLWAWHIACYDEIREGKVDHATSQAGFAQRLKDAGMETRGVDAVKAGPESKEEYCFIADNKGFGSKLTEKSFPLFCEICETVQSTQQPGRPLLLKNPWDFGNAPLIKRLIPSARFVYIHRHPIETINSMWKFLNQVFREPNHYMAMMSERYTEVINSGWRWGALSGFTKTFPGTFVNILIYWFGQQCDEYLKSIDQISDDDKVEITFDQLCGEPNETIQRIRTQLNLPDDGVDFSTRIQRRARKCDPLVESREAKINRRAAKYLDRVRRIDPSM